MNSTTGPNKSTRVYVRITEAEREMLQKKADEYGLTISAYLRMLVHKDAGKKK